MILEFSIGNFRSIKDIQHISFVAANIVSKSKEVDENNTFQATEKHRLLRSKVIYGANASGKSNFVRGLDTFFGIIKLSVKNENILNIVEPFLLSTETEYKPTFFQLFFILEGVVYRYGFESTDKEITSEWLFGSPKSREVTYFIRDNQNLEVNSKYFKEGHRFHGLINESNPIFRKNSLFLTALAAFNGEISQKITNYFLRINIMSGLEDKDIRPLTDDLISKSEIFKQQVVEMLKKADIGIKGLLPVNNTVSGEQGKNGLDEQSYDKKDVHILTFHSKYDENLKPLEKLVPFSLDIHESEGSRKMYEMAPSILMFLEHGGFLVIDEFDARLHPRLSKKIIELFNSPKTNPKNAQLLVVTHDTNLLSAQLFRRDQICFVEKDKYEASHIYTLAEFKGVRNDASFEKDYLDGRYGAVPFLNGFSSIFEN